MVLFGISAGVPYLLITSTLYQWLLEEGLSESTITAFAVFTFPFSLKVFWSHFIDALKIPFLHRFGQYRSWFVLSQVSIFASLITLSQVVHTQNILLIALVLMTGVCIYQSNAYKTRTDTIGVNCFFAYLDCTNFFELFHCRVF
jgi:hypothetical protein